MRMSRITAAAFTAVALVAGAAPAQELRTAVERLAAGLAERSAELAVMALRTQAEITYGAISAAPGTGRLAVTDLRVRPNLPWDRARACVIVVDRLEMAGRPLLAAAGTPLHSGLGGFGIEAPLVCLPPEAREGAGMLGIDRLRMSEISVDLAYELASAAAALTVRARLDEALAAELDARFSYLWFDASADPDEPRPVASLRAENLGAWEGARPVLLETLPPPLFEPDSGPGMVAQMLTGALRALNRDAVGPDAPADADALTGAEIAFIDSAVQAWGGFLKEPGQLVIETGLPAGESVRLDFPAYEDDARRMFADLAPRVALVAAPARNLVPGELLAAAMNGEPLIAADRRRVGLALLTGQGAPRNVAMGAALIGDMAREDGALALAMAEALAGTDPAAAYRWALRAGAQDAGGAGSVLDSIETSFDFTEVLELQHAAAPPPAEPPARRADIRANARARLTGQGQARSYEMAATWALLAQAAGDRSGTEVLRAIEARADRAGPAGKAAWARALRTAEDRAMRLWLEADLPARLGRR